MNEYTVQEVVIYYRKSLRVKRMDRVGNEKVLEKSERKNQVCLRKETDFGAIS